MAYLGVALPLAVMMMMMMGGPGLGLLLVLPLLLPHECHYLVHIVGLRIIVLVGRKRGRVVIDFIIGVLMIVLLGIGCFVV